MATRQACVWVFVSCVRSIVAQPGSTHTSCGAQGQMVHLLGDRAHHAGRLHGHSVVHGWRDHCTLVKRETRQREGEIKGGTEEIMNIV